jgi:hypothetical protein
MQTQAAPEGFFPAPEAAVRYRVEVLPWAEVGDHGVSYLGGSRRETLQWASVLHALAAEVGEPEGVRTVVFDLVVEQGRGGCQVCRFDADPGPDAQEMAVQIATGLGRGRCSRSLLELAHDGAPGRHVADLETLAEAALKELGL